jgi:hypothetical protein
MVTGTHLTWHLHGRYPVSSVITYPAKCHGSLVGPRRSLLPATPILMLVHAFPSHKDEFSTVDGSSKAMNREQNTRFLKIAAHMHIYMSIHKCSLSSLKRVTRENGGMLAYWSLNQYRHFWRGRHITVGNHRILKKWQNWSYVKNEIVLNCHIGCGRSLRNPVIVLQICLNIVLYLRWNRMNQKVFQKLRKGAYFKSVWSSVNYRHKLQRIFLSVQLTL